MDFHQAESQFKKLKGQYKDGKLTETEFKDQLEELMVQDEAGTWWMIGYETEKWYRNVDGDWVRADPPADLSQKTTRFSNWVPVLRIMLGFGFGWGIGGASLAAMMRIGLVPIGAITVWTIGWAIGGFVTGRTLYFEHDLTNRKSTLWITLGWAISFLIGFAIVQAIIFPFELSLSALGTIVGVICGGIGGFVTAITLRNEHALSDRIIIFWITLAWSIGGAIGGSIGGAVGPTIGGIIGDPIGLPVGLALGGGIAGGIGGFVTIWQIKKG